MANQDLAFAKQTLQAGSKEYEYFSLRTLEEKGFGKVQPLPYVIRIFLENLLRHQEDGIATPDHVRALLDWPNSMNSRHAIPFMPSRVVLQDFTGVPAVVDLAALRGKAREFGKDPSVINPLVPSELVIDHSVQVDFFGTEDSLKRNVQLEFGRNSERYRLLKWAKQAFDNFLIVPPGVGIVHQVNLEYLARVVDSRSENGKKCAFFDTLVGTDSHTTMIDGLGVLGFGVGGIEAEAVMLGQPYYMPIPDVLGFRLFGKLKPGVTATDLVLTITWILRKKGVVGKFVEFFGEGLRQLALPDRATISNMSPEYGATAAFFPIDQETLDYLTFTGRPSEHVALVEAYTKAQFLFCEEATTPKYKDTLELDLDTVEPTLAGPKRPHDKVFLKDMAKTFSDDFKDTEVAEITAVELDKDRYAFGHGSVAIAAITSCTNTSNPDLMVGAGILAKNAIKRGLRVKPYVKTSLAPGSRVAVDYLEKAGLLPYLEALGFHVVGFGCTTCIGNSGPLPKNVEEAIKAFSLNVAAVLSGNRNFEARIHPLIRANYLASPMLVVAFALMGSVNVDLTTEPIGFTPGGEPVYLSEIWPDAGTIKETLRSALNPKMYTTRYEATLSGSEEWQALEAPKDRLFAFDPKSTYIKEAPFFQNFVLQPPPFANIQQARVLAVLGDSITTDHISPAGSIPKDSPAGRYLIQLGIPPEEFNSYGARRGNHEVMVRGTFANVRLKNLMLEGVEGGDTLHLPSGERMSIFDASRRYQQENVPLLVIAGKEYGSGSSRDWAAKGPKLLGVQAVLAESFERIHRSNLVGMGVLPMQFIPGENRLTLGLTGHETYDIEGIPDMVPHKHLTVRATRPGGETTTFEAIARVDNTIDVEYLRHGGILPFVLRKLLDAQNKPRQA